MALSRQIPVDDLLAFLRAASVDLNKCADDTDTSYWLDQIIDHIASLKPEQKLIYSSRSIGL
jgi:hypothetical protein